MSRTPRYTFPIDRVIAANLILLLKKMPNPTIDFRSIFYIKLIVIRLNIFFINLRRSSTPNAPTYIQASYNIIFIQYCSD